MTAAQVLEVPASPPRHPSGGRADLSHGLPTLAGTRLGDTFLAWALET